MYRDMDEPSPTHSSELLQRATWRQLRTEQTPTAQKMLRLPGSRYDSLEQAGRSLGATPEQFVSATLAALLHRYSGGPQATIAGESLKLRFDVRGNQSFCDLAANATRLSIAGEHATPVDLALSLNPRPTGVAVEAVCLTAALDIATARAMLDCWEPVLRAAIASPATPIELLPMLSRAAQRRLVRLNATRASYDAALRVDQLVARQAARTPDAVAIEADEARVSYGELDDYARRLASGLRSVGAGPRTLVGVALPRSCAAVATLLGVLKAGAAYVPFDPSYPADRLAAMATDARPPLLIAEPHVNVDWAGEAQRLSLAELLTDQPSEIEASPGAAEDLAYVLYTSGSTGRPKGVAMPHRPLLNLLSWQARTWGDASAARTLQFASLSFDVSFQEIFSTWATGGTLILVDDRQRRDPKALLRLLREREVERAFLPVVALHYLAEAATSRERSPRRLREVITAGEQLKITPAVEHFFATMPSCRLVNHYGPTETHVVTSYEVPQVSAADPLPPIGRPIANVQIHLLDGRGEAVPPGAVGELFVAGDAVAQGYWRSEELTAERFLPDPRRPGGRVYRTGDLARLLPSGDIQFLGRADRQVKIRGHRVELDDVAAALEGHAAVAKAVVIAQGDAHSSPRLAAYVVPREGANIELAAIEAHVRDRLPQYLRPAHISIVGELPLTPSGKVDERELAKATPIAGRRDRRFVPPRSAIELQVAQVWEELLQRRPVGVLDNFFELGGDSLRAAAMLARIERCCGLELSVAQLMAGPTVSQIAQSLGQVRAGASWSPLVPLQVASSRRPFYFVHPAGGNVLCYLQLAECLGPDQPVYGVQAAGVDGVLPPGESIEAMAQDYVQAIRAQQPQGPYAIGGWSLGGTLAYEMARQFHAIGETVAPLVIIDMGISYSFRVLGTLFPNDEGGLTGLLRDGAEKSLAWFRKQTQATQIVPPEATERQAARIQQTFHANICALMDYRPGPYPGEMMLFLGNEKLVRCRRQPADEFRELGCQVELHSVTGNHLTIVEQPHIGQIADAIRDKTIDSFKSVA
jgi:amino acid adenylation domain-containing protein